MSTYRDPELDGLGDEQGWDPQMRELAYHLRASSRAYTHVQPSLQFRRDLRRRLMREAWEMAARPPQPWYRRFLAPQPMAMAGAVVGAILIVSVAFLSLGPQQHDHVNVDVVSPQQNAQLAPAVTPIQLQFSQPMQTDSVQLQIVPTTLVKREWDPQHKVLTITPVNALTPDQRYTVTVKAARTANSQAVPVANIRPVVFSTGPTPTPTPTGPRPTPAPSPIVNARDITSILGASHVLWSIDGSSLYLIEPNGALEQVSLNGGTPQQIATGVSLAAVAPDGTSVAWLSDGQVTWKTTTVSPAQPPIALGFQAAGGLLVASASDVETADQKRLAGFKETATAADINSLGDHVAYLGASGLHLVDLATGRDTTIGAATALGGWSPDGQHYAYVTAAGVSVANVADGSTAALVSLPGVTGLSWSRGQQLLMAAAGALYLADFGGSGPATAQPLTTPAKDGTFTVPVWAPNGTGEFSFIRGSDVWVAKDPTAVAGAPLITPVTPGVTQDDLVNSFMKARENDLSDQALSFLDAAGKAAFGQLNLVYTDPALARYYVLLSQPGTVVVRLVLTHALTQTALDETLTIQSDANNHLFIHAVTETPRLAFGTGPEVVRTSVTQNQVQVTFDSDLDPNSAQSGAVSIKGVTTTATYDRSSKTVTLTVPAGLTPGTTYDLSISPSLVDLSQRNAVQYDLKFSGPTS